MTLARVLVGGTELELTEVLADVTLRHGRASVDDGALASTATLTLVGVTRARIAAFSVGDTLELFLAGDVPRFRGRLTDARLAEDGLRLVAVSSLATVAGRKIGAAAWPAESWRARILRVFTEARILVEWQGTGGAWNEQDDSWEGTGLAGRLTLDTVDDGPLIVARAAEVTTLAAYLGGNFRNSEDAAIANLPDGSVLVQQLAARAAKPEHDLDSDSVLYAPEFEQTDELENELELTWSGGVVHSSVPDSMERYETRPAKVDTELAELTAAATRAELRVTRRAYPRYFGSPVELLELNDAIAIGVPLRLHDLPAWAPRAGYLGLIEGWEDRLESDGAGGLAWSMRVFLSDPRLSGGFGILWVHADETYATSAPATWFNPAALAD